MLESFNGSFPSWRVSSTIQFLFHRFITFTHPSNPTLFLFSSGFRKAYQPPAQENILRFRSHHYQGESHPSSRKSVVTVQISDLFKSGRLDSSSPFAKKKLLLLAGVRWDALGEEFNYPDVESLERAALEKGIGRIKMSCERFPEERMNLKWCSDTIDKLIEEANVSA